MTRIIAGSLGGRHLRVPPRGTRPTADRVREAVFARLDAMDAIRGSRVLDAFAGSGALGIEALSRGAERAVFVESHAPAARVISTNLKDLDLAERASVIRSSVGRYLTAGAEPFDLVLLDPPYDLAPGELTSALTVLVPHLAPEAVVVLEWGSRNAVPSWPNGIVPGETRRYGDTTIHYATAGPPDPEGGTLEA